MEQERDYSLRRSTPRKGRDDMDIRAVGEKEKEIEYDDGEQERRRLDAVGPNDKCSKCGGYEHFPRDCSSGNGQANYTCNNCGGKGHYGRGCPSRLKGKDKAKARTESQEEVANPLDGQHQVLIEADSGAKAEAGTSTGKVGVESTQLKSNLQATPVATGTATTAAGSQRPRLHLKLIQEMLGGTIR